MTPNLALHILAFNIHLDINTLSYQVWFSFESLRIRFICTKCCRPRDILSVPVLATLAALVLFLLQPPVPAVVRELINAMSGATMPLSMVVIGSSLGSVSLADAFRNKKLYLVSFIRLILAPVLVALLANLLVSDPLLRLTCIIIAACPSAVIISVLAIQYGKDYVFTSEGILQSTALSMLTIPLILYFFA